MLRRILGLAVGAVAVFASIRVRFSALPLKFFVGSHDINDGVCSSISRRISRRAFIRGHQLSWVQHAAALHDRIVCFHTT
jgi:hypothetical protein